MQGVRVQPRGSCELAPMAVAACSAGAEDSWDLAGAVGGFLTVTHLRGRLKSVSGASSQEHWVLVEEAA